jgi:hypothetical protein
VGIGVNSRINIILAGLALAGCTSGSTPSSNACTLDYSGNLDAQVSAAGCASMSSADGGDPLLVIDTTSAVMGRLQVMIDLGPSPVPAVVSSDDVNNWNAVALGFGDAGCAYTAGSTSVPFGSFELSLDAVPDAGPPHGNLTVVMYVHAPPATDCGPTSDENVHVTF